MNLLGFRHHTTAREPASEPARHDIQVIAFERVCTFDRRRIAAGILSYFRDGNQASLAAGMTWEALSRLRSEASRLGCGVTDDQIVQKVLTAWAREHLEGGAPLPRFPEGPDLLLTLEGGPLSAEPRRLLTIAGVAPNPAP